NDLNEISTINVRLLGLCESSRSRALKIEATLNVAVKCITGSQNVNIVNDPFVLSEKKTNIKETVRYFIDQVKAKCITKSGRNRNANLLGRFHFRIFNARSILINNDFLALFQTIVTRSSFTSCSSKPAPWFLKRLQR
ncbi:hypothetical protein PRIPAC_83605, partial [Pristionchus pacificus]|uniref:Uncharacterized protein n=1 Tax=Pristionchus pacificus TaxID=54126 RepID=A0A2A6BLE0_PRIPA